MTSFQANNKKSRWYLTFLPNGAAEEEENDSDEHEEEDEEEISIHGDVAVYLYQVYNDCGFLQLWHLSQVSAYENYVTSLKFKISFLNSRTGACISELCDIIEVQIMNRRQDAGL